MSDTIIYGPEFDVNVVMYSSPKANPQGGKNVNILNKTTKSKLRIQTPLMLTWGAAEYVDEKTGIGNGKFDMALQFPNDEFASPETDDFLKTMTAFQNKIKTDALTNSKEWFGKIHKSAEIIDNANKNALRIKESAKEEALKSEQSGKEALKQSGRDLILDIKSQIEDIFSDVYLAAASLI